MRFRDVAVAILMVGIVSSGSAQVIDLRLQAGPYVPLLLIADNQQDEAWTYSVEQTSTIHVAGTLILWWSPTFGASISGSVVNPDVRRWGYYDPQDPSLPSGRAAFERREHYMQTQLTGKAVLRVVQVDGFAADAAAGVAFTHFASSPFAEGFGSSAWGPTGGVDLVQRISAGLSAVLGAHLTRYELPNSDISQTDLRIAAGLQFRLLPWPK